MLTNSERASLATEDGERRLARALSVEWMGQTAASLFWIVSVFTYGISSTGDWLQLAAASSWFVANLASLASTETP